jgi:hypothetical protein
MEIQKTHRRKKDSALNIFINWLNTKPVGYVYTCAEARKACHRVHSERLGYMHGFLMYSKCVKRVARGKYEILGYIPDFVTQDLLEGTCGYTVYNFHTGTSTPRGAKWFMGDPNPYEKEEVKVEVKQEPEHPVKRMTTGELLEKQNYILAFISDTEDAIGAPGGWIAREANWDQIALAKKDLMVIETELNERRGRKQLTRDNVLEILSRGLSHQDTADAIMKLTIN